MSPMLDFNLLMGDHKNTYRPGYLTTLDRIGVHDFIVQKIDKNMKVDLNGTYLSTAFDLIRPSLLLKNLTKLGIPNLSISVM